MNFESTLTDLINYQKNLASMNGIQLTSWEALKAGILSTGKAMLAWLTTNPFGWAILATGSIAGLVGILDLVTISMEEAQEELGNSVSELKSATKEFTSLESEIKACTEKIEELQKFARLGTLSITDKEELRLLQAENEELERRLAIEQSNEIKKQKGVLDDIEEVSEKEVKSKYVRLDTKTGIYFDNVTPVEELVAAAGKYDEYKANPEDYKFIDEQDLTNASNRIQEMYDLISPTLEAYDALIASGYELTSEEKSRYEQLKQAEDTYLLHNYNLYGTKEAFQALNAEQQKNIFLNKLLQKGLSTEHAQAILNNISEENYDDLWNVQFSFTPPNPDDYDSRSAEEYGKAYAEAWLNSLDDTINTGKTSLETLTSASDGISVLSNAIKELTDSEYLSLDSISSIKDAVGDSISNWDEYEKKLMSVKAGTSEYN